MTDSAPHSSATPRSHLVVLAFAVLGIWAHQLWLFDWVVDDAAISFAYARNLASGEGLVVMPGGERIEGYSNPLWVLLLAAFELVGVPGMQSGKLMPLLLSAACAWLAYRIVARESPGPTALVAPLFLAASAQFAIWNASGLENPLFTTLVLAGLYAVQRGALVWAGLAFAGLALTRPEGVAYGGVIGLWMVALHRREAWRYWVPWVAPVAAHQAFRWGYFAWPLPNTYYAKLGASIDRWSLEARGWKQLLAWAHATGIGWLAAVFAAGAWGRVLAGLAAMGVAVGALWLPDVWRVGVLVALGVAMPAFAPGPPLWRMAMHLVVVGLAFGVYAGGDWMRGHRWMSLVVGPLALLLAAGARVWIEAAVARFGDREVTTWAVSVGLIGGLLSVNAPLTVQFSKQPVDYPEMIARRLAYTNRVADRIGLDRSQVSTLEMDMGAHMLWSEYTLVDLAGLVDIPIARHTFADRDFMRSYVFEERRPTFAHLHRFWAKASGLTRYREWKRTYVHLPPYKDGPYDHDGVWLRRDLVFREAGEPERHGSLALDGFTLAHDVFGSRARLDVAVHPDTGEDVRLVVRGGGVEVPVDLGWVSRAQWRGQTFVQPVYIEVAGEAADFELVADGVVVATVRGSRVDASVHRDAALGEAEAGRCARAVRGWQRLRDLHPDAAKREGGSVRRAIADCLARTAAASGDAVSALAEARGWDHHAPEFVARATSVAAERYAAGLKARANGDAVAAFDAFSDVLRVTPWNAWARRYAEEARDRR